MTLGSSNDILAPGRSTGHSNQNGSGGNMAPRHTNKATGCGLAPGFRVTFGGNTSLRLQHRPQLWWDHRTRHGPQQQQGLDVIIIPDGNAGHSDRQGLSSSVALKHQQGPRSI
ncbi:hypothetical protein STEG23_010008 [Scotinomys teguina]